MHCTSRPECIIFIPVHFLFLSDYPEKILLSGSGPGSSKYPYRMGEYTMVAGLVQTGRPVWLHATRRIYLFYGSQL